mgnify:CR=1 FL=1
MVMGEEPRKVREIWDYQFGGIVAGVAAGDEDADESRTGPEKGTVLLTGPSSEVHAPPVEVRRRRHA